MNIYAERIEQLRKLMKDAGIGLYYVPMDDCHASEYVADYFKCIRFMTGFTGSAGHLIVTEDGAWMYADGRYYVQAEQQLEGSTVQMLKWAAPGVPEPEDFIADKMQKVCADGLAFGFDGTVVTVKQSQKFLNVIAKKCGVAEEDIKLVTGLDLVNEIWKDRPAQEFTPVWKMEQKYVGETCAEKLGRIRAEIAKDFADAGDYSYLISGLDDIAWIFNIRANDIPENPEAFAYAVITKNDATVFLGAGMGDGVAESLAKAGVGICNYSKDCLKLEATGTILMDFRVMNRAIYDYYKEQGLEIKDIKTPSTLMKGIKNDVEMECAKAALLRDSLYVTRFMYWLKGRMKKAEAGAELKNDDGSRMSELSVDEKLDEFRTADSLYIEKSFSTIAAYKENGAMMHYEATPESYKELSAEGMLLIDSGVQFKDGTTDITRTFILGPVTEEERKAFTLTAVATLRLQDAKFIKGCRGQNLDILAREPMWKEGWDYKCGTGHGIGHVLNVHEGPHAVRWKIPEGEQSAELVPGMIMSDEPGVYRAGRFGIRTENEIFVKPFAETEDGTFYCFEPMTFIPIDLDGIDKKYMDETDVKLFNTYHAQIFEKLSPLMNDEEKAWLKEYTREI